MAQTFKTAISIASGSAASQAVAAKVEGDTNNRVSIDAGGKITWGSGSATGDTTLYRSAADTLKTDDTFIASGGVVTLTSAGAPTATLDDGALAVDTTNDVAYIRSGGAWVEVAGGGGGVTVSDTAPVSPSVGDLWFESDTGDIFVYYDSAWIDIGGSSVANIAVTTTPPTSPVNGDLWFDTDTANTYVYYNDGTSGQWVEIGAASAAASGTDGAVQFASGGAFSSDASNFVWDDTNNRLGIGTTSPAEELHITKDQNADLTQILIENLDQRIRIGSYYEAGVIQYGKIQSEQDAGGDIALALNPEGGNVGIGTTVPSARLQVEGNIQFGSGGTYGAGQLYSDGNWGAILRAKQSSPAVADFSFRSGSDTERMRIDSAGRVTMPYQPCFYAYVGGTNPSLGAGWVVVPLNSELFDNNSDFNTSTYRFVAPVSGKYLFTCTFSAYNIDVSQTGSQFVAAFYKNGTEYNRIYQSGQYTTAGNDRNGSGSAIISLAANDYVELRLYSPDTSWQMSAGAVWNSMSGFLIG